MEIIKKTQRTLTALAVFFLAALSAAAQNVKLTISDLVFEPTQKKEVSYILRMMFLLVVSSAVISFSLPDSSSQT